MMSCSRIAALACSLLFIQAAYSQSLFLNTSTMAAREKQTRTDDGRPGIRYWQNGADYDIHVTFDPATNILSGEETFVYSNNSPDTLRRIILRLYPDFYKKGVSRITPVADKDLGDGVSLEELRIGEETIPTLPSNSKAYHTNTNLTVLPEKAILPNSQTSFFVKWHYTVNTGSQVRTGRVDSGSYFIAYFFPRIAVYDDMDGWDDWSYNGVQEFYNDFGNFRVGITVPKNYMVWATGERQNASDNLGERVLQRLHQADVTDKIVHVIDSTDYINHTVFAPKATGLWQFQAKNISDFSFAISDHYLWDASSVLVDSVKPRRTLVSAAYNPIHKDYFDVADQANRSVYYMSHYYPRVPFPFPQITVFDGTSQMEYPMMVNDNPTSTHKDAVQLTSHEIFHSYFPFYMGINETQYAWMDEGWATIGESVISPLMGEPEDEGIFSKTRFERISGTDKDIPLIVNTKLYDSPAYISNSYGKGGICYWVLQDMLGDSLYFKALHLYMNDWHGKHPIPSDFFNSFNRATGRNLNWFWQKWFYDWVYPDLGITQVVERKGTVTITIKNKGGLPLPVFLTIDTGTGKPLKLHFGVDVWATGKQEFTVIYARPGKIRSIQLGNDFVPDKNKEDNTWKFK